MKQNDFSEIGFTVIAHALSTRRLIAKKLLNFGQATGLN